MKKGNGLIVALLIILIVCVIAAIAVMMLNMMGIIGNNGSTTTFLESEETQAPEVSTDSVPSDTDAVETYENGNDTENPSPDETTAKKDAETTSLPKDETTAKPSPETTVKPTPETTTKPTPETTAKPAPETTSKPSPETTADPEHVHSWRKGKTLQEAACTEKELVEMYCSCGAQRTGYIVKTHRAGNWITDVTCTSSGSRYRQCIYCGITMDSEELAALGHQEIIDKAKEATCTENGLTKGKHCYVCNTVIVAQETIPALGHDEGDWVIINATATKDGKKTITCRRCGEITKTEIIPANGYSEGLNFRLNDDGEGYTVIGIGDCKDTDLVIPSEYKGLPVTTIGSSAFKSTSYSGGKIKSLVLPNSIVNIEDNAFYGQGISTVIWSTNLKSIGVSAFEDCKKLTVIDLPNSVSFIGASSFYNCTSAVTLSIPNKLETISARAFYKCSKLKTVIIPNSVSSIEMYAFAECTGLETITFGNQVKNVGMHAFSNCTNLIEVYIYDLASWCQIDFDTEFSYYGNGEKDFDSNPLYYAHHLYLANGERIVNLQLPKSVERIGQAALAYSSIKSVSLHDSFLTIEDYAFIGCSQLQSIDLGKSVNHIGYKTFADCVALKEIIIPDSVTYLGSHLLPGVDTEYYNKTTTVFRGCSSLSKITFGRGIEKLGSYFSECDSLSTIILPEGITELHYFFDGTNVKTATIPKTVKIINGMYNCNVEHVILQDGMEKIGYSWFSSSNLKSIQIPTSVTTIEQEAFRFCKDLEIYIPATITYIGRYAFEYCKYIKVHLPESYNLVIHETAFVDCEDSQLHIASLESWNYTRMHSEYIGSFIWGVTLYLDNKIISNLVIPDGTTVIRYESFYYAKNIISVYIPKSVTTIGDSAFHGCSNLSEFYYEGTMSEWKKVKLGGWWKSGCPFKVVHCSDGDIKV